ncbi:MAG: ABC transporter permease subunit [Lachnospiraceae bacterium]|nr:ABC transporter permease subunit [Lachnospiraceae bacterium]
MKQKCRYKNKKNRFGEKSLSLTLLSAPTLIWYLVFCYFPLFGIIMAFKRYRLVPGKGFFYSLIYGSDWVGFDNFRFLFLNPEMGRVVGNTVLYNLVFLVLETVIPVVLAIWMSYIHSKIVRTFAQISLLLPYFMSWIIVSYLVYAFLSPDRGTVNALLEKLGMTGISFYQRPEFWPFILCLVQVWKSSGYIMMLYYARMVTIDNELFDAAAVDGASAARVIRHIILPELKSVIVVMTLLNLGHLFSTDFGLFYQVTRNAGSILSSTETIDVFIYKALMEQSNYGFSAAASLIQNGIGCMILIFANQILKRTGTEGRIL